MEVLHMVLVTLATVLVLAGLASSELSPKCKEMEKNCDNAYLVEIDKDNNDDVSLCRSIKDYSDCIHGLECGITRTEKETLVDNAMNDLEGIICDLNSATRPCGISVLTVLATAVLMLFKI